MKILSKNTVTPFFLVAALSMPFATYSYGMISAAGGGVGEEDAALSGSFGYAVPAELSSARPIVDFLTTVERKIQGKVSELEAAKSTAADSTALGVVKSGIIVAQSTAFQAELAEVRNSREFFAISDLALGGVSALRNLTITGTELTPPPAHDRGMAGHGYNYGYYPPYVPAKETTGLAFTARIGRTTTGNTIVLDTQNLSLYVPSGENKEAIVGRIKEITDRFSAQQGHMNQWFTNLPDMWNTSLANLQQAQAECLTFAQQYISPAALATVTEPDFIRYFAQLNAAQEKVKEKEKIHTAMQKIKAFVDETLEYLRKNSKVS